MLKLRSAKTAAEVRATKVEGGHAVLITGIYRDKTGKVVGFRIQNSWGKNAGNSGYYYMDRDYFETYVMAIMVREPPTAAPSLSKFRKFRRAPKPFHPTDAERPHAKKNDP